MEVPWSVYELFSWPSYISFGHIPWEYLGQPINFSAYPRTYCLKYWDYSLLSIQKIIWKSRPYLAAFLWQFSLTLSFLSLSFSFLSFFIKWSIFNQDYFLTTISFILILIKFSSQIFRIGLWPSVKCVDWKIFIATWCEVNHSCLSPPAGSAT